VGFVSVDRTGAEDHQVRSVTVKEIGGFDARLIAVTAVMIAVVFVMTKVVQISIGPGGYIHFGDIALYVASFLFGPIVGFVAGGTGTALSDLSSGYGAWAPGTFVIHGLQAFVAGLIAWRGGLPRLIMGVVAGGVIVVVGYFLYQWLLISAGSFDSFQADEGKSAFATAAAAVWPNTFQVLIAAIIAVPLIFAVRQAYPPVRRWGAGPSWVEE
jgi:energy-coupling factor transport system substrate-specific component